ncbi:ribose-phosphate pyrophosphokinase [Parachlamydia sp. AcF125]|uniref:ribose-phosphate diphosphokinase n=1 Tax=Parachlamydia sp. AcF125 TaxID=2795736 RepID=UPI001BC92A82|nr:ribose-phosphate pyrophosphokinase [Parachlamydia sp. AcF125]MBS4168335.1 Ribose-phosphate pyrophosphokinase [Parachlamydia sp. AcF125]
MPSQSSHLLLFSGSSHPVLAQQVADYLGVKLGQVQLERFPDGEISVQVLENVRGRDTFVIQPIALDPNNYLMELLIMIDALKRASAHSIAAVIPYYGYCRQDRKDKPRVPITAKLVANLLVDAGATRILTMDLHAGQLQGFFDIPVDNLQARPRLGEAFNDLMPNDFVVVAPDVGSVKLARDYAHQLGVDLAIASKHRINASHVQVATLFGNVNGKDVLLADDMCSTAGTLVSAAKACQEKGARRIFAAITHGLFIGDAVAKIEESPIETVLVSNTIPYTDRLSSSTKIKIVSVASLLGQAISCILSRQSISSLYEFNEA